MKILCLGLRKICLNLLFLNYLILGVSGKELTLFFINAHNLFDTTHDLDKNDYAYLPIKSPEKSKCRDQKKEYQATCLRKNWDEKKLEKKIKNLCELIIKSEADIVSLVEVENKKVLKQLAIECGYPNFFMTEGNDPRGIDQAIMYKNKKDFSVETTDIPILGFRSLLEAKINFRQKEFFLYTTHWPSQLGPTQKRMDMAKKIAVKIKNKKPLMIWGDFNIVEKEEIELEKIWPYKNLIADPTYFYAPKMQWNFFDRLYLDNAFYKNFKIVEVGVYKPSLVEAVYEYDDSRRPYYGSRIVGIPNLKYSDHFPLIFKIK